MARTRTQIFAPLVKPVSNAFDFVTVVADAKLVPVIGSTLVCTSYALAFEFRSQCTSNSPALSPDVMETLWI